jgi:hypothetical protein
VILPSLERSQQFGEQGEILFQVHRLLSGETENRVAGVFQLPGSDRLKPS